MGDFTDHKQKSFREVLKLNFRIYFTVASATKRGTGFFQQNRILFKMKNNENRVGLLKNFLGEDKCKIYIPVDRLKTLKNGTKTHL